MSLQYGILGLLRYAPMNGYNLKRLFDNSINFIWSASLSQIYRELGALEKKGYVSSSIRQQDDRPDKRIHSITEEGRKAFLEWLNDFPEVLAAPKRDEFMLRVFFGSQLDKAELVRQFERFVEERKRFELSEAGEKEAMENKKKDAAKYFEQMPDKKDEFLWAMIGKRAQMTNRVLIAWAEGCIRELEDFPV
jgi:PadR family transcriptional regulator, regulatory protein AphA